MHYAGRMAIRNLSVPGDATRWKRDTRPGPTPSNNSMLLKFSFFWSIKRNILGKRDILSVTVMLNISMHLGRRTWGANRKKLRVSILSVTNITSLLVNCLTETRIYPRAKNIVDAEHTN